jgi:hypothetical protein
LPDTGGSFSAVLSSFVANGQSPIRPALEQTLIHAAQSASASGRKTVVVLMAEDIPNACGDTSIEGLAQLSGAAAAASPSVVTYVIGVGSPVGTFDPVTTASGGVTVQITLTGQTVATTAAAIRGGFETIAQHACAQ